MPLIINHKRPSGGWNAEAFRGAGRLFLFLGVAIVGGEGLALVLR